MKTQSRIFSILILLTVLIMSAPATCIAFADKTDKNQQEFSSPPAITVTINVDLTPDCEALQTCQFEVLVFDVSDCAVENPPIDRKNYTYGQTVVFSNLTIDNAYVKVCVRVKPGTTCTSPNNAPKCVCKPAQSGTMNFDINICPE